MPDIEKYIRAFRKLHVDRSKGFPAPHKAILLLAVLEGVTAGEIVQNRIYITPDLVARFKGYFTSLVDTPVFVPNFALPFYHMSREQFWFLRTYPGKEIVLTSSLSIKSFKQLKDCLEYAFLDEALFILMTNPLTNRQLREVLLDTWFAGKGSLLLTDKLSRAITGQILHDSPAAYRGHLDLKDEEDLYIRGGIFKKLVPKLYQFTCCISGLQIIAESNIQMIDACHIRPFSETHDDTISKGISLCPTLHRAFDRGLIGIDDKYEVIVGRNFKESAGNAYSISQFKGMQILLPGENSYCPSLENLSWHRKKWGL
ncbi:MAG TPA: HNH endonuclease [Chitinophagaceae bacterium]|nr:HNH endonuclease [Chitinophagaceae bacterium]